MNVDLEGSLAVFGPISVLQLINLAQSTGELVIEVGKNSARIYFEHGTVTYAKLASRKLKLGESLVAQRLLSRDALERALAAADDGTRIGTRLVSMGAIDEPTLRSAIEEQIKEVVYEVVRWKKGHFRFANGRKPKAQDVFIDVSLELLILEGLKRMDEEGAAQR